MSKNRHRISLYPLKLYLFVDILLDNSAINVSFAASINQNYVDMPTVNPKKCNINSIKLFKEVADNAAKKQVKVINNIIKNVFPTIFPCKLNTETNTTLIAEDANNGRTIFETKTNIVGRYYVQVLRPFIDMIHELNPKELFIASYILGKLRWNSNVIRLTYEEVNKVCPMRLRLYADCIASLRKHKLIASTDIDANTYIINHNAIFYGDIKKFIEIYNEIYDGKYAPVNGHNKVVIKNSLIKDFVDDDYVQIYNHPKDETLTDNDYAEIEKVLQDVN